MLIVIVLAKNANFICTAEDDFSMVRWERALDIGTRNAAPAAKATEV